MNWSLFMIITQNQKYNETMKKSILAIAAIAISFTASAQYIKTEKVGNTNGFADFTSDGKVYMVAQTSETLTILNDDFSPLKEIPLQTGKYMFWDINGLLATQRLFNDDDKWEYVGMTYDQDNSSIYHVYNEDGVELGIIPSTTLMTVGDKSYIYETAKKDDGTTEYTLYAIEKANDSALSIRKLNGVNVFPNPVAPGETIRFEMPDGNIAGMEIYDGAGVQKLRRTDVDSEATTVPANKLSRGVNAYRIIDENGQTFTGKIIVK